MSQQPQTIQGGKVALGGHQADFLQYLKEIDDRRTADRIWKRDARLWKDEPGHIKEISERLGWLTVTGAMRDQVAEIQGFADEVKEAALQHVILCGMGGSSLCPEVLRLSFGSVPGYPRMCVLDSTDPSTIAAAAEEAEPDRSLILIASKSGGTIEVDSLYRYFYDRARAILGVQAGQQFAAITDPNTGLQKLAQEKAFRKTFLNPPDIGGRYSALSLFGLVPAALLGLDVARLLDRAEAMAGVCSAAMPAKANPGVWLGAALGIMAKAGRDKLTLLASPTIDSFGLWVEQLIAESTGKEGKGIVPIAGEPIGPPEVYGNDRFFVFVRLEGDDNGALDLLAGQLEAAGQPVVTLELRDLYDLGAEFFRWEFATAVAGAILEIDPFDQPNVQESKDNTSRVLAQFQTTGTLPAEKPDLLKDGLELYGSTEDTLAEAMKGFVGKARQGDYFAIAAYLPAAEPVERAMGELRERLRARTGLASTLGYGPRFLHSTGQLHKGGPNSGLFIQFTAQEKVSVPIPGKPYDFGTLKQAQATGDWQALQQHGRRALWVQLGTDIAADLQKVVDALR